MVSKPEKNFLLLDHITLLASQCRASVIPKMVFLWDPKVEKRGKKKWNVIWGAFIHNNLLVKHMTLMIFITDLEKLSSFDKISADFIIY